MTNTEHEARVAARYSSMDRPRPHLAWSKLEILLGLFAMRLAFSLPWQGVTALAVSAALFVLGGYLALAGHRSHLYDAMTRTAATRAE
jgi:hypothetical protein